MMSVQKFIDESRSFFKGEQFDKAEQRLKQAWQEIIGEATQVQIQEQNDVRYWLGCCSFEKAQRTEKNEKVIQLLKEAIKYFQQQLSLAKKLCNTQASIEEQYAYGWLGRCYLELAIREKIVDTTNICLHQAIRSYYHQLDILNRLEKKEDFVKEQIKAQNWLGHCYSEQSKRTLISDRRIRLIKKALQCYSQQLDLIKQAATTLRPHILEQAQAHSWIGGAYLEWALHTKNVESAEGLLNKAIDHHKQELQLSGELDNQDNQIDKQNGIIGQIYAQYHIGCCYFEQARRAKDNTQADDLFQKSARSFKNVRKQIPALIDWPKTDLLENSLKHYLKYFAYREQNWMRYFEDKKAEIKELLFISKANDSRLSNAISTILAVLNIPTIELGSIPLAHYTSPIVCHKLFGIGDEINPLRIGSSTYMNDPSEGKTLLEFLDVQDLELENKVDYPTYNAFFTCFSSRVNDLNQFRLYGKEDGIEASGCCLVVNKNGDWLKEVDLSSPFRSLASTQKGYAENGLQDKNSHKLPEIELSIFQFEKLPLYQIAYIAYEDEYISREKCGRWLEMPHGKFGIRLKPIGDNKKWHEFRLTKLEEALQELMNFLHNKNSFEEEDKQILEYIRYLFKDFAFRDEEEFRLMKIAKIDAEEVKYCEASQSVFIPYSDIRDIVDEVILGTNYEKTSVRRKAEVFQYQMRKLCPDVKVSRSSLPINPPLR